MPNSSNPFDVLHSEIIELKSLVIQLLGKPNNNEVETQDNPLTIKEVASLVNLSIPTIYGYVQKNNIPHYKNGNRLVFFRSEIIDWLKKFKVKTLDEINRDADTYLSNKKMIV
ncbi:MAG TPA: helix-turn-helix domain-containing protein [Lutibacter sp.]